MKDKSFVIVHVDDSPTARELVKGTLEDAGYVVHSAIDAQDFEQRLMAKPEIRQEVDLIILDMEMPDMLGAQVGAIMESVYDELSRVPFFIYSGKDMEWVQEKSREVEEMSEGFVKNHRGYVGKGPGSEELLLEKVKKILEGKG